jgi:hypothetical protein
MYRTGSPSLIHHHFLLFGLKIPFKILALLRVPPSTDNDTASPDYELRQKREGYHGIVLYVYIVLQYMISCGYVH